jgi:hypothetical protein
VIILAVLFSSFMKSSDPSTETVCGIWKGYYGTEKEINSIAVKIDPQNKAEVFYNYNGQRVAATYKLIGDSAIIISCKLTDQSSQVILQGNLNRTSSFIDGQWDSEGTEGGCFYLQKQFEQTGL